jgi:hypothetical protein
LTATPEEGLDAATIATPTDGAEGSGICWKRPVEYGATASAVKLGVVLAILFACVIAVICIGALLAQRKQGELGTTNV